MKTKKPPVPLQDITLRDFFAVFAMQAIISKYPLCEIVGIEKANEQMIALGAYSYADEMMEARK